MNTNTVYEMVIGAIAENEASEEYAKIQNEFSEGFKNCIKPEKKTLM